jgi:hypothetical protein
MEVVRTEDGGAWDGDKGGWGYVGVAEGQEAIVRCRRGGSSMKTNMARSAGGATQFQAVGPCAPRGTASGSSPSMGIVHSPGERRRCHLSACRPAVLRTVADRPGTPSQWGWTSQPWDELWMSSSMA